MRRPNILWISNHDTSAHNFGCYGDAYANTPNINRLAAEGIRYSNAFTAGPICSPSRTSIYTGMHPTTLGTHHHRSAIIRPAGVELLNKTLMDAGYACTKPDSDINLYVSKEEYDTYFDIDDFWNKRPTDKPFFACHKLGSAHASVFKLTAEEARQERSPLLSDSELHDPVDAPVPTFIPDTPLFRERMAQFYDAITNVDREVGQILATLETQGLSESTIVVFWGDHGSGYPRGKVHPYDDGLHIPLIIKYPSQYRSMAPGPPGTVVDDLVMHMDLAPTTLSMAGIPIPDHYQGRCMSGVERKPPRKFVCGARDRLDNHPEMTRTIRTHQYRYNRNFLPHQPYASFYPDGSFFAPVPGEGTSEREFWETSCLPSEQKLHDPDGIFLMYGPPVLVKERGLPEPYAEYLIWQDHKPQEELYDIEQDPEQIQNLANDPAFETVKNDLRTKLFEYMIETEDLGLFDETEIVVRAAGHDGVSREVGRSCVNLPRILETADLPRRGEVGRLELLDRLTDPDAAVRYWAATGLLSFDLSTETARRLEPLLEDTSISVSLATADYLVRLGEGATATPAFSRALNSDILWSRLRAGAYLTHRTRDQLRPMKPLIPNLESAARNPSLFGPEHDTHIASNQFTDMLDAQRDVIAKRWVLDRARRRIELS